MEQVLNLAQLVNLQKISRLLNLKVTIAPFKNKRKAQINLKMTGLYFHTVFIKKKLNKKTLAD